MSDYADDLADRISHTLTEWLAAHGGGMVGAFELAVNFYDEDGERSWATAHGPEQTVSDTLGLLRFHTMAVERHAVHYLDDDVD